MRSKLVYPEFSNWNVTENYVKRVTLMWNGERSMISGFMSKFRRLGTEDVEGNFSFKKVSCQEKKIKAKYPKMRGIDRWMDRAKSVCVHR